MSDTTAPRTGPAIALMVLAMCLMASMDATSKWLVEEISIPQILLVRFGIFLIVALALAGRRGFARTIRSQRPGLQIIRSIVMLAEITVFIWAFSLLPLADVHAIAAISPLMATALAVPLLREKVGWHRWSAVVIGFIGVLIIVRPGSGVIGWAALVPLLAAFLWALLQVLIRKVGLEDSVETTALYSAVIAVVVMALFAPFTWQAPTGEQWAILVLTGVLGSAGLLVLFKALQLGAASALQPFSYSMVLWAIVLGFLIWGHFPDAWTLTGVAIVVAGGLYAFSRERAADRSSR
ncbi:MAG: DMT family transporter [Alphaproteobacteria bacterium]